LWAVGTDNAGSIAELTPQPKCSFIYKNQLPTQTAKQLSGW
jgi:hypothetical protein